MGPEAVRITSRIVVILWHGRTGVCATAACHFLIWLRRRSDIKPVNQAIPSPVHPISSCPPPPSLYAPPTTDMSTNLYETLGVQRGVSEDQSMSNPRTCLVPPLNALLCLQSERPIRNEPYKHTQIVFHQSRKNSLEMSSERSLLSMHPLCCVAHSWSVLGQ